MARFSPNTAASNLVTIRANGVRLRYLAFWVAAAIAATFPLYLPEHLLTAAIIALHMCYLAQCWNLSAGYAGQFSLGHALFFGIGAYTAAVLLNKAAVTPWIGLLAGAVLAGLAGALVALVVLRYRIKGVYFALVTLGVAEVAKGLADNWDFIGGPVGLLYDMRQSPANFLFLGRVPFFYIIFVMVLGMVWVTWRIQNSKLGQRMLAVREDEDAAEASGVDTFRTKLFAITISAALTAIGGTFYAQFYLYITPETVFNFEHQINMMLGTMIGGAGTILGPVLGSLVLSVVAEVLRYLPFEEGRQLATASKMLYAVLMMGLVIYMPGGVISLLSRRRA